MSTYPSKVHSCDELRVLLVDDEDAFRTNLADILREDGHDVRTYRSPAEVPALSGLAWVGVVITDFDMPGGDGFSFADRVHAAWPDIPVVIVTAHPSGTVEAEAALRRDFLSLLSKSVPYERIHEVVHALARGELGPEGGKHGGN